MARRDTSTARPGRLREALPVKNATAVWGAACAQAGRRLSARHRAAVVLSPLAEEVAVLSGAQRAWLVLRRLEAARWPMGPRLRIVAPTAPALQGGREQCLAADMEDHVTQPVRADALIEARHGVAARKDG